ncbi:MAG: PIG-L family deacetylase [Acidobacteria bacterium]|nr:PIG-L family deacetylase [Acidobacteriota bacterium]
MRALFALAAVTLGLTLQAAVGPEKAIVVIGAHADDLESLAGASVAKYIARGYKGIFAVLTTHRAGAPLTPGKLEGDPLEAIQLHSEAAIAAARRYRATPVFFNLHPTRIRHGRSFAFTGSPWWSRFMPPGTWDISAAPARRPVVNAVAALLVEHNPELVLTHGIGEGDIEHHSGADIVYRAWTEARRRGARLGQLWFRSKDSSGMLSEASFRRFFEPARVTDDFFALADAREPEIEQQDRRFGPQWETALAPPFTYRSSRSQPVVMAVGAHCDDIEVQTGGTLVNLLRQGWKGLYVVTTNNTAGNYLRGGEGSTFPVDGLETIQVRQEEGRRAAAMFGLEPHYLNLHELVFYLGRQQITMEDEEWGLYDPPGNGPVTSSPEGKGLELMTALLEQHEPDLVIAHLLSDKPEHGQSGDLVYRAFKQATARGARLGQLWMPVGRFLPYFQRVRLHPDISIDVTEDNRLNWEALQHHVSQNAAGMIGMKPQPGKKRYEHFIIIVDNTGHR